MKTIIKCSFTLNIIVQFQILLALYQTSIQETTCPDGQYQIEYKNICTQSCESEEMALYDNKVCIYDCPHMYQNQAYVCVKVWDENTKTYDCNFYMNETYEVGIIQYIQVFKTEYECIDIPQNKEKQFREYYLSDYYGQLQQDENQQELQESIDYWVNITSFKGQFPRVYFSERLCKLLENDKCKKLDKQQQVEYKEGWQEDNKWKYEEEFYQGESFIQWQYISTNQPLGNNSQNNQTNQTYTCQVNISYNYAQDVQTQQRNYKTHYQCIDITSQNEEKVKQILVKELWGVEDEDYQYYQEMNLTAKGQLPRIYFNKELCNYLENTQCNELNKKQYAYLEFSAYQNQELLQQYEGNVTEEQNWIYVSSSSSQSNSSSNATTNSSTSQEYYDCELKIIINSSYYLLKTIKSQYQCIEISSQYQEEIKNIFQQIVTNNIIQSVSGQIPKVYINQDICEKIENTYCKYLDKNQQIFYSDQYYENNQLLNNSFNNFYEDTQFYWRYIANNSQESKYCQCQNTSYDYIEYVSGQKKCLNPSYVKYYEENQNGERICVQQCSKYYTNLNNPHKCINSCKDYYRILYDNKICVQNCPHMYQNQSDICVKVWDDKTKINDCDLYINETFSYENELFLDQYTFKFRTEYECVYIPQDQEKQVRTHFWTDLFNQMYPEDDNQEDIQDRVNTTTLRNYLPRVYFSENLCKLLENDTCRKLNKLQQVEYKYGRSYYDNQWEYYEQDFIQFYSSVQWQYMGEKYAQNIFKNQGKTDDGAQSNNNQLTGGEIAGIAIGCVAAVGIIIAIILYVLKNKKNKTNANNTNNTTIQSNKLQEPMNDTQVIQLQPDNINQQVLQNIQQQQLQPINVANQTVANENMQQQVNGNYVINTNNLNNQFQ